MSKILLGMSGGTDSSVAAWILKRDVREVVGVTLCFHDSQLRAAALERAQACAKTLGIEHHVVDLRDQFKCAVKDPTAEQFSQGLYPYPCSSCMRELKIPALFEQAERFGCDTVATGHYARITQETQGYELLPYQLRKPLDKSKDQTYLLYSLDQDQLAHMLFPLENLHKGEVRRLAMQAGLVRVAPVNDGQGEPCFYDGEGCERWLEGEGGLAPKPGDVVYLGTSEVIAEHEGIYYFAPDERLRQRHLARWAQGQATGEETFPKAPNGEDLFVVYKDAAANKVYAGARSVAGIEMCLLRDVHWTSIEAPSKKRSCRVKTELDRKALPAQIVCEDDGVVVAFNERVGGICAGQTLVLYSDDLVLGGGIVAG